MENYENLRIPCEHYEYHENLEIPFENYENNENTIIPNENHKSQWKHKRENTKVMRRLIKLFKS